MAPKQQPQPQAFIDFVNVPGGDIIPVIDPLEKAFVTGRIKSYKEDYSPTMADWIMIARMIELELSAKRLASSSAINEGKIAAEYLKKQTEIIEQISKVQKSLGMTREQEHKRRKERTGYDELLECINIFLDYKEKHQNEFVYRCDVCGATVSINRRNTSLGKKSLKAFESGEKPEQKEVNIILPEDIQTTDGDYSAEDAIEANLE